MTDPDTGDDRRQPQSIFDEIVDVISNDAQLHRIFGSELDNIVGWMRDGNLSQTSTLDSIQLGESGTDENQDGTD